ncbi:MAG TPA: hypothetical protein VHG32_25185 [Thermoanaerobaculia bacterium]|jgi:hypothetical protein|nr:hypothetical protein [Thermoanaerobaculia bacterium]
MLTSAGTAARISPFKPVPAGGATEATQVTVERARKTLCELIELSGLSRREVERRLLETDAGTDLGRLLSGRLELKLRHVLDITRVIEVHPLEFVAMVCGRPRQRSPLLQRVGALFAAVDGGRQAARSEAVADGEALEQLGKRLAAVVRMAEEMLAELRGIAPAAVRSAPGPQAALSATQGNTEEQA